MRQPITDTAGQSLPGDRAAQEDRASKSRQAHRGPGRTRRRRTLHGFRTTLQWVSAYKALRFPPIRPRELYMLSRLWFMNKLSLIKSRLENI